MIYGILLAGGKSTRMGSNKAHLNWYGQSLLDSQFERLSSVLGKKNVFVSGDHPNYPSIPDLNPNLGPLEGLRSTLHACIQQIEKVSGNNINEPRALDVIDDSEKKITSMLSVLSGVSLLVIPVDMPLMNSKYLTNLILTPKNKAIDVVHFNNYELPALFNNVNKLIKILDDICKINFEPQKRSFRYLYKQLNVSSISASAIQRDEFIGLDAFMNTNTKEEWNEALSKTNNSSPSRV